MIALAELILQVAIALRALCWHDMRGKRNYLCTLERARSFSIELRKCNRPGDEGRETPVTRRAVPEPNLVVPMTLQQHLRFSIEKERIMAGGCGLHTGYRS